LEAHLGIKLIVRSTRHLRATEAGQSYYSDCCAILDRIEEVENGLARERDRPSGLLRISAPETFGRRRVAPHVWSFLKAYPGIDIDIDFNDRHVDLVRDGFDLAIRSGIPVDSSLTARTIASVERVVVASPEYLGKNGTPNLPRDLKDHRCIVYTLPTRHEHWSFSNAGGTAKVQVTGRLGVNSPEAAVDAALNGLGLSLSPKWLVQDHLTAGRLVRALADYGNVPFKVHALYPDRQFLPAKTRLFVDHLKANLKL
jgi:DNA-binding transcriptional LysR family regulator